MPQKDYLNQLLQHLLQIGPIPPAVWRDLAAHIRVERYRSDRYLPIRAESISYVAYGIIEEIIFNPNAGDPIQRFIQPGDFIVDEPQEGNRGYLTVSDTTLLSVSPESAQVLFSKHPTLGKLYVRILRLYHASIDQRLRLLLLPKRQRYAAFILAYPGLAAQLLDKDILRYLDISPGYFSRSKS